MNTQNVRMIHDIESEAICGGGGCAAEAAKPWLDLTKDLFDKLHAAAGVPALCEGGLGRLFCRENRWCE
jgi:hypothetical protein